MTMLERAARAIADAEQQPDAWPTYERSAIAAIKAIEAPTAAMIKAVAQAIAGEMAQSADLWGDFEHVARPAIAALFAALREDQA